ncbi:hypothetical protein HII31_09691 [Pseudocercospora fuligena]|uniref:Uncharacterized protein n=1 Tax=Pseudocercospora fuligena TaxID=685502 RepID=A0A8H6RD30_9PEZI|nr:hypothetical protein HII31_09691 [Pseudocercospora fuligena]
MAELDVTSKMYEDLYNVMINKFFAEDYDGADKMASSLLLKADLPLIYRVWCYMILGTAGAGAADAQKQNADFLSHAQSAVNLINDSKEKGVEFPENILKRAAQILEHAKEAMLELKLADAVAEAAVAAEEEDVGGDAAEVMDRPEGDRTGCAE